ncbi:protein of unknown function (plasmid) [Cupriavidus taiwanensis]|uniref:Uncharacterized protein n=1 Tax=Cupriavidus taiwanensis TaxID=164546 RepID=A0A375C7H0_9BURK|nr:hypothetical protein CBM2589_A70227 [Cupriavidus taiwanensis]SPK75108.1 protein of unknown function [Cupriavidus taiwanensis]
MCRKEHPLNGQFHPELVKLVHSIALFNVSIMALERGTFNSRLKSCALCLQYMDQFREN